MFGRHGRGFRDDALVGSSDGWPSAKRPPYAEGQGVPQDYAAAMRWYRKAAEQGVANAQNNLGLMYAEGKGVAQDSAAALSWFRKAAAARQL
jgi:TPR repeat protein